jgi:hypothetical protein
MAAMKFGVFPVIWYVTISEFANETDSCGLK